MLHGWCHVKCCRFGASSVYTSQPCTKLQCPFIQSHIGRVYVCLAVTCHLHFWQNDRGLLCATAVTRGRNGCRNKSQHIKLTLEKKILPPHLPGLEPGTFRSRVLRSNHTRSPSSKFKVIVANVSDLVTPVHSTCSCVLFKIQTHKRFKRTLFIRTKHSMRIFGVIPFT